MIGSINFALLLTYNAFVLWTVGGVVAFAGGSALLGGDQARLSRLYQTTDHSTLKAGTAEHQVKHLRNDHVMWHSIHFFPILITAHV